MKKSLLYDAPSADIFELKVEQPILTGSEGGWKPNLYIDPEDENDLGNF